MSTVDVDAVSRIREGKDASLYRTIFERATDGIAIIAPDGTYVEQNPAHERLTGWTTAELLGRTPRRIGAVPQSAGGALPALAVGASR